MRRKFIRTGRDDAIPDAYQERMVREYDYKPLSVANKIEAFRREEQAKAARARKDLAGRKHAPGLDLKKWSWE